LGIAVKEKMFSVLNKNLGFDYLKLIKDVHCGMNGIKLQADLIPLNIGNMKFAPMTSVEGECSFSRYKSVF
jgi:hypothetical protein